MQDSRLVDSERVEMNYHEKDSMESRKQFFAPQVHLEYIRR